MEEPHGAGAAKRPREDASYAPNLRRFNTIWVCLNTFLDMLEGSRLYTNGFLATIFR